LEEELLVQKVIKPSVLQLQQFGIPSHSGNHHLLAPSNVISKLIYFPFPASPFSHPATSAPATQALLEFVRYTNFVIIIQAAQGFYGPGALPFTQPTVSAQ